jgi:hypothetical protein
MFSPEEVKYPNGALVELPYPSKDVSLMTKAATEAVNRLFRLGFKCSNAEVLLTDLRQPGECTDDLFAHSQPVMADTLTGVLDDINGRWGRRTLRVASVPKDSRLSHAPGSHEPELYDQARSVVDCQSHLGMRTSGSRYERSKPKFA